MKITFNKVTKLFSISINILDNIFDETFTNSDDQEMYLINGLKSHNIYKLNQFIDSYLNVKSTVVIGINYELPLGINNLLDNSDLGLLKDVLNSTKKLFNQLSDIELSGGEFKTIDGFNVNYGYIDNNKIIKIYDKSNKLLVIVMGLKSLKEFLSNYNFNVSKYSIFNVKSLDEIIHESY